MVEPIANTAADSGNDSRAAGRLGRILISTLFVLLFLVAWLGLPFEALYVGYGLASAFLFQVAVRPRRWEIVGVLAGGGVLTLIDQFVVRRVKPDFQIGACLGFIGLVSFLVLGLRAVWADREEQKQLRSILIPAAGFTIFILGTSKFLGLSAMLYPRTMDIYAYAFDGSLGFQPAFMVGQWFKDYPLLGGIGRDLYEALPLAMALVYAAYLRLRKTAPLLLLEIFMCAGLFGYFLYLAFPATGPVYLTGPRFPGSPTPFSAMRDLVLKGHVLRTFYLPQEIGRNAMPSLHMTWALLMAFNCKPFSRLVRAAAVFFVFATVLGTLGTGEHYFIDLVVAFPFAVAIQALATRSVPLKSRNRLFPAVGGATLALLWLVLLRFAIPLFFRWTPLVPWLCVIASTALSALWMKQILSVEQSERQDTAAMVRAAAAGA
ncbi:MAG: phosphatase PAP2 family protein [Candidatus Sulfotelmatobacter sp.]